MTARVLSIQVARVGALPWRDAEIPSAIFKRPVDGPIALHPLGFDGDEQADRKNHGGPDMAVCVYPVEHIPTWEDLVGAPLEPGAFGENLRTEGLVEAEVCIGDTYGLGTAVVQVSQPRGPCYKVAARHGVKELPARLARDLRAGFLLRVLQPGVVVPGDAIQLLERRSDVTVAEVLRVAYVDRHDDAAITAVLAVAELATSTAAKLRGIQERRGVVRNEFGFD